jgi:hypothetical protein
MDNITLCINGYEITYYVLEVDRFRVIRVYDKHLHLIESDHTPKDCDGQGFFEILEYFNNQGN